VHKMMIIIIMARHANLKRKCVSMQLKKMRTLSPRPKVVKSVNGNEERIGMLCDFALSVIKYMLPREFFV
jgi:hypothetical protein